MELTPGRQHETTTRRFVIKADGLPADLTDLEVLLHIRYMGESDWTTYSTEDLVPVLTVVTPLEGLVQLSPTETFWEQGRYEMYFAIPDANIPNSEMIYIQIAPGAD